MNPMIMTQWLDHQGMIFLKEIGLKKGDHVLDFGCRHGTYSIPASKVVGRDGHVFAVDKNKDALEDLLTKASKNNLNNISTITGEEADIQGFDKHSLDMVLLYDVLHLIDDRMQLLSTVYTLLKPQGILSVYPRHHREYMNMTVDEVISEIESLGFQFEKRYLKNIMHDDTPVEDWIFNFRK